MKTVEECLRIAKEIQLDKHRCCMCNKMSYYTHSINSSPWMCYDGCFSTTGRDKRTKNGIPEEYD